MSVCAAGRFLFSVLLARAGTDWSHASCEMIWRCSCTSHMGRFPNGNISCEAGVTYVDGQIWHVIRNEARPARTKSLAI